MGKASTASHDPGLQPTLHVHDRPLSQITTTVDIVTVNWNSGLHLSRALASINATRNREVDVNVIVIDNGSADQSLELARESCPDANIVVNHANRGFAAACNQGAGMGTGEYILFMNPDVQLNSSSLQLPLGFLRRDVECRYGICGIRMLDGTGNLAASCARFPTTRSLVSRSFGLDRLLPRRFPPLWLTVDELSSSRRVDQVIGAFFLVRRKIFENLAGFDERFFMYFEEVDFSYRAFRQGYASYYLADAHAIHVGGGSSGSIPSRRLRYSWESRVRYAFKHFPPTQAWGVLLAVLLAEPVARSVRGIMRGSPGSVGTALLAAATFWGSLATGRFRPIASG